VQRLVFGVPVVLGWHDTSFCPLQPTDLARMTVL
jgi:hypothetical protein